MLSKRCLNKTIAQEGKRCENVKINIAALACKPVAGARQSSGCNCCRQFVDEGKSRRARARAVDLNWQLLESGVQISENANFCALPISANPHQLDGRWEQQAAMTSSRVKGCFKWTSLEDFPGPPPICQGSCRSVVHNQQPFCPWPFGQPSLCCPSDSAPPALRQLNSENRILGFKQGSYKAANCQVSVK